MFKRDHQNQVLQQVFVFVIAVLDVLFGFMFIKREKSPSCTRFRWRGGSCRGV